MRRSLTRPNLVLVIAMCVASFVASCSSQAAKPTTRATHRGTGVVVSINAEKARVKINHEKIEGFMEAMTMWFDVADPKLLDSLAPNDRIEFVITEEESSDVVTEIKKM